MTFIYYVSIAITRDYISDAVCLSVCLSVCLHNKTKTAETKVINLDTGITIPRASMIKGQRSRLGLRLGLDNRVTGVSYALYRVPSL